MKMVFVLTLVYLFLISFSGHQSLVEWLNETLPYLNLPWEASEDELRACLRDGTVLCSLLNQLSPGSMRMVLMNFDFLDRLAYISFVLSFWLCFFFPLFICCYTHPPWLFYREAALNLLM